MTTVTRSGTRLPAASVVIAAFADERWPQTCEAIASVRAQTVPALETVVVIDHNPALLARAEREFTDCRVIANAGPRGASGARNTGAASCRGEVIAFLDDDARSSATWLAALLSHFRRAEIVGVGGRVEPRWAIAQPRWFPAEFGWAVGFSYQGMPERAEPIRNVWAGNMAIRSSVFEQIGGFRESFGKVGDVSRPEDTDLCLRAAAGRGIWLYEPTGSVAHWIPRQRATFRYFARRCFHEGQGKAALAALDGARESTAAERSYTCRILPHGVLRGLKDAARGDPWGAARAAAIAAGLATTAAGFAAGWLAGVGLPLLAGLHGRQAQALTPAGPITPANQANHASRPNSAHAAQLAGRTPAQPAPRSSVRPSAARAR
jgi:glucosyl-dolichyl phosphate glucuronosyltransferase